MQVTCPNCRARYAVDPLAIGPLGRTVQCARCAHRWFETVTARQPDAPETAPDVVIRPSTRPPALPAVIEPKTSRQRSKVVLIGLALAAVVLAAGIFTFHEQIAEHLPDLWRSLFQPA